MLCRRKGILAEFFVPSVDWGLTTLFGRFWIQTDFLYRILDSGTDIKWTVGLPLVPAVFSGPLTIGPTEGGDAWGTVNGRYLSQALQDVLI